MHAFGLKFQKCHMFSNRSWEAAAWQEEAGSTSENEKTQGVEELTISVWTIYEKIIKEIKEKIVVLKLGSVDRFSIAGW